MANVLKGLDGRRMHIRSLGRKATANGKDHSMHTNLRMIEGGIVGRDLRLWPCDTLSCTTRNPFDIDRSKSDHVYGMPNVDDVLAGNVDTKGRDAPGLPSGKGASPFGSTSSLNGLTIDHVDMNGCTSAGGNSDPAAREYYNVFRVGPDEL